MPSQTHEGPSHSCVNPRGLLGYGCDESHLNGTDSPAISHKRDLSMDLLQLCTARGLIMRVPSYMYNLKSPAVTVHCPQVWALDCLLS